MNQEQFLQYTILLLRDAIVEKEMILNRANIDFKLYGQWQCDYQAGINEQNDKIEQYKNNIEKAS